MRFIVAIRMLNIARERKKRNAYARRDMARVYGAANDLQERPQQGYLQSTVHRPETHRIAERGYFAPISGKQPFYTSPVSPRAKTGLARFQRKHTQR